MGATGLVGSHLVSELSKAPDIECIKLLTRRHLGLEHPIVQEHIVDFESLPKDGDLFICDDVFIAFGTTIAVAGNQSRFKRIDLEIPLEVATKASAHGATHCFLVSSVGADPNSRIFYNKTKGELEKAIAALDFASFYIFRPSILLGNRDETRLSEAIGIRFGRFLRWIKPDLLGQYSGMPADLLARSMVAASSSPLPGKSILHFREISNLNQSHE